MKTTSYLVDMFQLSWCRIWLGAQVSLLLIVGLETLISCEALSLFPSNSEPLRFLAKTKESFKLSDLQYLSSRVEAEEQSDLYNITRLVVDDATGSSIFLLETNSAFVVADNTHLWETQAGSNSSNDISNRSLSRCEWIAQILKEGESASDLIELLSKEPLQGVTTGWTLEYLKQASGSESRRTSSYTSRTLFCSISHILPCPPALSLKNATDRLVVLEASTSNKLPSELLQHDSISEHEGIGCDTRMYLAKIVYYGPNVLKKNCVSGKWASRPFQYSSALNFNVAEIIVDTVLGLVFMNRRKSLARRTGIVLWDPTCGSGTILAIAMDRGMQVVGFDSKIKCAQGTLRNLEHLFGNECVERNATIQCKDSALAVGKMLKGSNKVSDERDSTVEIDCVVANLPWGVNSVDYRDENESILRAIRACLEKNGAGGDDIPCAFVTRDSNCRMFEETGFKILGQAHIPPKDFELPKDRKHRKSAQRGGSKENIPSSRNYRNNCVITFAKTK